MVQKLIHILFWKNENSAYLWINCLKFQFIFIVYQAEGYQNSLKLACIPLAFTSYEAFFFFKKKKKKDEVGD